MACPLGNFLGEAESGERSYYCRLHLTIVSPIANEKQLVSSKQLAKRRELVAHGPQRVSVLGMSSALDI